VHALQAGSIIGEMRSDRLSPAGIGADRHGHRDGTGNKRWGGTAYIFARQQEGVP